MGPSGLARCLILCNPVCNAMLKIHCALFVAIGILLLSTPFALTDDEADSHAEQVQDTFDQMDTNKDGRLTLVELKKAVKVMFGDPNGPEVAKTMKVVTRGFPKADGDNNGWLDKNEFESLFNQVNAAMGQSE